jgi:hypothetical protein
MRQRGAIARHSDARRKTGMPLTPARGALTTHLTMAFAVVLMALHGCASTTTVASWKDPQAGNWRFRSVLIMAVAEDQLARRAYEDAMAGALAQRGVRAATSYSLLPGSDKLEQADVDAAIADQAFEAVLVTHVVGVDEETVYYPGRYEYYSRPVYGGYYHHYTLAYDMVYRPGYTRTYKTMSVETNLYRAPSGRVIWGMRTHSVDPDETNRLVRELVHETVKNLDASGFIS